MISSFVVYFRCSQTLSPSAKPIRLRLDCSLRLELRFPSSGLPYRPVPETLKPKIDVAMLRCTFISILFSLVSVFLQWIMFAFKRMERLLANSGYTNLGREGGRLRY